MVINTLNTGNPFADFGEIVTGDRFIGREIEIQAIQNRVLGDAYGNLAIMGLPRIGKSSLIWNALYLQKQKLKEKNILVIRLNIATIKNRDKFFNLLISLTLQSLKTVDIDFYNMLKKIKTEYDVSNENTDLEFFFELVKQRFRVLFILDEFDNASQLFKLEDFQFLRELSINPETKICLITVSRRTIQEIEPEQGFISNFFGVFSDLRLLPFSDDDLIDYWGWVQKKGIDISDEYKAEVLYLAGKHPFLIDLINYNMFNEINRTNILANSIFNDVKSSIKLSLLNELDTILRLMKKENLSNTLVQLVNGPIIDVKKIQTEKLLKYGLLYRISPLAKFGENYYSLKEVGLISENNECYISFSSYFDDYILKFRTT